MGDPYLGLLNASAPSAISECRATSSDSLRYDIKPISRSTTSITRPHHFKWLKQELLEMDQLQTGDCLRIITNDHDIVDGFLGYGNLKCCCVVVNDVGVNSPQCAEITEARLARVNYVVDLFVFNLNKGNVQVNSVLSYCERMSSRLLIVSDSGIEIGMTQQSPNSIYEISCLTSRLYRSPRLFMLNSCLNVAFIRINNAEPEIADIEDFDFHSASAYRLFEV